MAFGVVSREARWQWLSHTAECMLSSVAFSPGWPEAQLLRSSQDRQHAIDLWVALEADWCSTEALVLSG